MSSPLFTTVFTAIVSLNWLFRDDLYAPTAHELLDAPTDAVEPTPEGRSHVRDVAKATDSKIPSVFAGSVPKGAKKSADPFC